jgi:hypothetical protein
MGDSEKEEKEKTPYETLGLSPDAALDQVKSRFRELNDAYLKILQLSKGASRAGTPSRPAPADDHDVQTKPQQGTSPKQESSHPQETRTEPIARIKARFAKGEIQKAQFEKLAKERYDYLKNKSFTDLTDSEFEERLHGFEGLKFL